MPAIDLPAVRLRAADIAALLPDIPAALAAIHTMLDDYADLTHRPSRMVAASGPQNALRTPMPILRALVTALREPAKASLPMGLELAQGLWAAGSREERRLAAELLGVLAPAAPTDAVTLIETWLPAIDSAETAAALGERAFAPLALAEPGKYLQSVRGWVAHPHKWVRRFGLAALGPLVRDKKWDDVPGALDALRGAMTEGETEVRKAVAAVLADLIAKSPLELARFLREQAVRPNNNTHWIIRTAMVKLPAEQQAEIVKVMRA